MLFREALVFVSVVLLMTGCNDPKSANDANFSKVISEFLPQSRYACVPFPADPIRGAGESSPLFRVVERNPFSYSKMMALQSAGLVNASEWKTSKFSGRYKEFSLTESGKTVYRDFSLTEASRVAYQGDYILLGFEQICFADTILDKIESFTEPADLMGARVSEVKFTYKFRNIAAWAMKPEVEAAFPEIKKVLAQQGKPTIRGLRLTSEGWNWY
jgi:hypothetical protein